MKPTRPNSLEALLLKLNANLALFSNPDSRATALKTLNDLIAGLTRIRSELSAPAFQKKGPEVRLALDQVIDFLNVAKENEVLSALLLVPQARTERRPKRTPVDIPPNLSNQQIRALLEKDLSKTELKAIAAQRGISVGKSSSEQIKKDILKNLERQEGYSRLGSA
jgi:hypothetical protein